MVSLHIHNAIMATVTICITVFEHLFTYKQGNKRVYVSLNKRKHGSLLSVRWMHVPCVKRWNASLT